jgi:hypothetical protein
MNLIWQRNGKTKCQRGIHSVSVDQNKLEINFEDRTVSVRGELVFVDDVTEACVTDYSGQEVSKIGGSDVTEIEPNVVTVLCDSAQQISNRCVIELNDNRTADINGYISFAMD